jgi:hypothetical protein
MKNWHQIPILLTLEHVQQVDATRNNTIGILLKCIAKYGKKLDEDFGSSWVCNGCDQRFFFGGKFSPLGDKKKRLANLTKEILGIIF